MSNRHHPRYIETHRKIEVNYINFSVYFGMCFSSVTLGVICTIVHSALYSETRSLSDRFQILSVMVLCVCEALECSDKY